jgi:exonuclease III
VGAYNTSLSTISRSSEKKKINKEVLELNDTIDLIELKDVYRVLHHATAQYTFFSEAHGIFSRIDHNLGHKISLNNRRKLK